MTLLRRLKDGREIPFNESSYTHQEEADLSLDCSLPSFYNIKRSSTPDESPLGIGSMNEYDPVFRYAFYVDEDFRRNKG